MALLFAFRSVAVLTKKISAILTTFLLVSVFAFAAEKERDLSWDDLIAPPPPEVEKQLDALMNEVQIFTIPDEEWQTKMNALQAQANPVVEELDGVVIRIPGYVVPIDLEANMVREFLLVPYLGACIHVPPPPPNQVIFVKTSKEYKVQELFDPIWVTGQIKIMNMNTDLAEAGYTLTANKIVPYVSE